MHDDNNPGQGNLYVLSAPSGAGKTSLVWHLLEHDDHVSVSISHTTRAPRAGEVDRNAYHFVDETTFVCMMEGGQFLEHAKVFDHYYGTSRAWVDEQLATKRDVLLEIDWRGARQIRAAYARCISIFVLPPRHGALHERLVNRTETRSTVDRRLGDALEEISHYKEYDYIIVNDDFGRAARELQSVFLANRLRYDLNRAQHDRLVADLEAQST